MLPLYDHKGMQCFFAKLAKRRITPPFLPYSSGNSPDRIHFTYDTSDSPLIIFPVDSFTTSTTAVSVRMIRE